MKINSIATTLALVSACVFGATSTLCAADESGLNADDVKTIKATAQGGMNEVKLATLGSQKAERAEVKEFATMLVADHTKANEELRNLATSKSVQLSASIDASTADAFKDLEQKSGKDFDDAFLDQMISNHKKTISNLESAEKDAKDGDLKAWIGKTLPTLKTHLEKAQELEK